MPKFCELIGLKNSHENDEEIYILIGVITVHE